MVRNRVMGSTYLSSNQDNLKVVDFCLKGRITRSLAEA
jgi:hypothetical protein